jgi:hypothetical protein
MRLSASSFAVKAVLPGNFWSLVHKPTARNHPARPLSIRLVEQSFCFLEIRSIEALSEPGTNGCKQILGLTTTSLSLQDSAEAHRRPQLKEPSTLLPCRFKGLVQTRFHLIATARLEKQFALESM